MGREGISFRNTYILASRTLFNFLFDNEIRPRESGFKLSQGIPEKKVADGTFIKGVSFPIHSARMKVGNEEKSIKTLETDVAANFTLELAKGDIEIQSWFNDDKEEPILGAYYMYVTKM
ncbi:MAG: hypothetical protein AAFQ94_11465 [Bacteroidota bacterium]